MRRSLPLKPRFDDGHFNESYRPATAVGVSQRYRAAKIKSEIV